MSDNDKIKSFVRLYFPAAVKTWRDTSIPVLFTLAQKGLESDWGNEAPQFNSAGLTPGSSWKGRTQLLKTTEEFPDNNRNLHKFPEVLSITPFKTEKGKQMYRWVVRRWFRAYDSAAEAWTDYAKFLKEQKRYQPAFEFTDAKQFADAIAVAGYATGSKYAKSLKACIDSVVKRMPELGLKLP